MFRPHKKEMTAREFIEKLTERLTDEELEDGCKKILSILERNPIEILNIINTIICDDEYGCTFAIYLLEDLYQKMLTNNCSNELDKLFDKCLDVVVEACIFNSFDLAILIKVMPNYKDKMMICLLSNKDCVIRIFENEKEKKEGQEINPLFGLNKMQQHYPEHYDAFLKIYNEHYVEKKGYKI